jgi:predicted metal-dependent HD superfamily phosphohydrolase
MPDNALLRQLTPPPGSRHLHYKGGLYRVEVLATVEQAQEPAILYRSLDPEQARLWMRPLSSWVEPVPHVNGTLPRFVMLPQPELWALRRFLGEDLLSEARLHAVLARYDEPQRFYHDRDHVLLLFQMATDLELQLSLEQALALLYHDAVYVPGACSGENERLSALLLRADAARFGSELLDLVNIDIAAQIIEDTARHEPTIGASELVLDLDLLPLAAPSPWFRAYNELTWLEYRHLFQQYPQPRAVFDAKRAAFLRVLAARGPLFRVLTEHEAHARENIQALQTS